MFRRYCPLTTLTVTLLISTGCAAAPGEPSQAEAAATDLASVTASEAAPSEGGAAESGSQADGATCPDEAGAEASACQVVPSTANIFGAGHDEPPAPGDGGAGTLPPMWTVPDSATAMIVTDANGTVAPTGFTGGNGPGGEVGFVTDISSHGGISGIVHRGKGFFLVGVFLTDETPVEGEHPERLGFTDTENFTELAPLIGQTFFIGDGQGKTFVIPEGATRLFLGFADAFNVQGDPGWYGNNSGQLAVTVAFEPASDQ